MTSFINCVPDTPPAPCAQELNACPNADFCTEDPNNPTVAVCFCQNGYELLPNGTCVGKLYNRWAAGRTIHFFV